MDKRERYLRFEWSPYPSMKQVALDWLNLLEFQREMVLQKSKKNEERKFLDSSRSPINIVGKLSEISKGEKYFVLFQGHLKIKFIFLDHEVDPLFDFVDLLRAGDVVLIKLIVKDPFNFQSEEEEDVLSSHVPVCYCSLIKFHLLAPHQRNFVSLDKYWSNCLRWQKYLSGVRDFFSARDFLEVDTPSLVVCPGMEPTLDPFPVYVHQNNIIHKYYLPTSPEIALKKLLSLGASHVFEIKKCFRDREFGAYHCPEFWMLEWYRVYADLKMIKEDLLEMIKYLIDRCFISFSSLSVTDCTMAELFAEFYHFSLKPTTSQEELEELCCRENISYGSIDSWNDFFYLLFLTKIEPALKPMGKVFIRDYPPSQAALARLTSEGWADRFEFYWDGVEIANAFHEVNDPREQERRNHLDQLEKCRLGKEKIPLDNEFMMALEMAMPPTGGIALGLERLYMVAWGLEDIRQLREIPSFC